MFEYGLCRKNTYKCITNCFIWRRKINKSDIFLDVRKWIIHNSNIFSIIYIYINQIKLFKFFFLILQHILYQIIHESFEAIYYISKLVVLWIINQYLISVFSRPDFIYKNTAFQHLCIYKSFFFIILYPFWRKGKI